MASYIPSTDSGLDLWANTFQAAIAADPALYGLTAGDATAITLAYTTYHDAYGLVVDPATRTAPTIAAKDTAKASALITFRTYAQLIQSNVGVSNDAKSAAGLTVRATGRTPVPAPGTMPVLGLVGSQPGNVTLSFSDSATPTTKAKPFGAIQMELYAFTGVAPAIDPSTATYIGSFTKSPFSVDIDPADRGKLITYFALWQTRRGLDGPFSAPLTVTAT